MRKETVVGLAWAGGLVAAMVAVFFYGLSAYEPERFDVRWMANEHTLGPESGRLDVAQSASPAFLVPGANVTSLRVTLTWTDDVGSDDRFEIEGTAPAGIEAKKEAGTSGTITLEFPLVAVPDMTSVSGANAAHALEQVERADDAWQGEATWSVTVRLLESPDVPGAVPNVSPATPDGKNDYAVSLVYVTHDATLAPA